ncbi:MAG: hypothetical protein L0216_06240, partial [Planctomycetales bacterium]|nr:hypothetical protein [Planctomycetales bacterium]
MRALLIEWGGAGTTGRGEPLRGTGLVLARLRDPGAAALRRLRRAPPDAVVIPLDRRPSQGRDAALFLRQQTATRGVPIVFVGGERERIAGVRRLLPDATFASWRGIAGALRRARDRRPDRPANPGVLAGYSGTPLPKKLGIGPGTTVALVAAPSGFGRTLGPLPEGARLAHRLAGRPRIVLLFSRSAADLRRGFTAAARAVADGGRLWLVWPKKTSPLAGDLGEPTV